jgi:hypothetical protein
MITFFGIIIFIIPFILVRFFKDKTIGFLTIFTSSFLAHLIVALVTQSLKIFNYSTIISIYVAIDAIVLIVFYLKYKASGVGEKSVSSTKMSGKNIFVVIAFAVVFFNLFSVHHNFSGIINSQVGEVKVDKISYSYPYFSDEWVAVSFVNYTILNHSLPIVNPLSASGDENFRNPLVPYFSFLSDIFLFFGLSPLNNFVLVTLLVGLVIVALFFNLLLALKIDKGVSALTILIIPYITNGGNLPGIWFLIPMVVSLAFYLISLIAFAKGDIKLISISSLLCLCLYPPFIVFVLPSLLLMLLLPFLRKNTKDRFKTPAIILFTIFLAFVIVASIAFRGVPIDQITGALRYYLLRSNLVGGILSFPIWVVLPSFVLPVAFLGLWPALKRKLYFLLLPLITGLIYWVSYIDTQKVFIIDFPRVVVITSFIILIFFALALDYLLDKAQKAVKASEGVELSVVFTFITIVFLLVALAMAPRYTENESWRGLMLKLNRNPKGLLSPPAPTASEFLIKDDLRLFSGFTKKVFISPPWKGLVISAATGNYPLATKPSTVGIFTLNYNVFVVDSDCKEKKQLAIENKIDYVYSSKFDCPNFKEVGESSEDLTLYKFDSQSDLMQK